MLNFVENTHLDAVFTSLTGDIRRRAAATYGALFLVGQLGPRSQGRLAGPCWSWPLNRTLGDGACGLLMDTPVHVFP